MKKVLSLVGVTAIIVTCALMRMLNIEKPALVETLTVGAYDLTRSIDAAGELKEYRSRAMSSGGYAIVDNIYVNVGDCVTAGQVLMTLTPTLTPVIDDSVTELLVSAGMDAVTGTDIQKIFPELTADQIIAPFDGVVTSIEAQVGEQVVPLLPAISISDVSRIRAVVRLDASSATTVEVGMPASVRLTGSRKAYDGVVTSVAPVVKTSTTLTGVSERYCEAEVELYHPDALTMSGTPVSVKISAAVRRGAVMAPYESLHQSDGGLEYLFVLGDDGTAVHRTVITGEEYDSMVEIVSGLSFGETIIVSADDDLINGTAVEVIPE